MVVAIGAIYTGITGDRRVPDYGLHGVHRVLLCGINGTHDLVVQLIRKASAAVAHTMLQPIFDEARLAARTCTRASLNNDKANRKGTVIKDGVCCCHPLHAEQGTEEGNRCLPATPQCEAASSRRRKLGVCVQDVVGQFCTHIWFCLAFRMVVRSQLGATPET